MYSFWEMKQYICNIMDITIHITCFEILKAVISGKTQQKMLLRYSIFVLNFYDWGELQNIKELEVSSKKYYGLFSNFLNRISNKMKRVFRK